MKGGEVMGVLGKSGAGKSTLLKCIFGLEDLSSGEIIFEDEQVLGPSYNLIPGHKAMQLVSQDFYVLENHSVEENIFDKLVGFSDVYKHKRATKILRLLELTHLKKMRAKHLSSGQKQRVAIARALAVIPKILLLDEPFNNLDKLLNEKLFSFLIDEVKSNNTAVILITHLPEEALKYANNLMIIDNGRIIEKGKTWDLYYRPKNLRLAGLLGDFNVLKKEDLENTSALKINSKLFLRPDKLNIVKRGEAVDLRLKVLNCSYNGKCFEVLAETKNGNAIVLYSQKKLSGNTEYSFKIN